MIRTVQFLLPFLLLFLCWNGIGVALGAEQMTTATAQMPEPMGLKSADDMLTSWLRMLGALVTVLSIFFMGVFLFRKYGGVLQNKAAQGHLKVLEYRALNQKNSMYVLDYQGERFLVATSQQGSPVLTPLKTETVSIPPEGEEDFEGEIRKAMNVPS